MKKLRIIVGGFIGILPAGGVTWDYVQYPLGFALLGHDVYYIEDTRLYPVYQEQGSRWDDCTAGVAHLQKVMDHFGFKDKWAYRDEATGMTFGMSEQNLLAICNSADIFINISCSTYLRDEYYNIPVRILIDSDPMFTQIQYLSQQMFTEGSPGLRQLIDQHNYHFSFGENIGKDDCRIPGCGLQWITTRQPICMDHWRMNRSSNLSTPNFTTLMNWTAAKTLQFEDEEWGQKDIEFNKFKYLPSLFTKATFSAVVNQTGGTKQSFSKTDVIEHGWKLIDPASLGSDWMAYRQFIHNSDAEFSIAKHTYVKANTGWFSCRSACYLASGKPVLTQDTGWSKYIPAGNGLFAFSEMNEAMESLEELIVNYQKHSKSAREIATAYFDSNKVLQSLLDHIN